MEILIRVRCHRVWFELGDNLIKMGFVIYFYHNYLLL